MKHFIALILIFGISIVGTGQEITVKTKTVQPKTAAKVVKTKQKVKAKIKPKAKIAAKKVVKPKVTAKSKITTIEAATKDGKPVTLKSNGTWQYAKIKPVVTATPTPVAKSTQVPTPKPIAKSTPVPTPKPVITAAKCDLTVNDSPAIRGLKLGMPRYAADRIIPSSRVTILNSPNILAYPRSGDNAGFEDIYEIGAVFIGNQLDNLSIEYDSDKKKWKNAKGFAETMSKDLNLPYKFWKFSGKNAASSEMQCRDFSIHLDSTANTITLAAKSSS